jgi:hypothetical protein
MFHPSTKKFFVYGLAIAGLEEFIAQGVLKDSYFRYFQTCGQYTPLVPPDSDSASITSTAGIRRP